MPGLSGFEKLPEYRAAVLSIYHELGESFNKHATVINLSRHVPKNNRRFVVDVVKTFFRLGLLRKHRTDTFAWTNRGLGYAKFILFSGEQKEKF